MDLIKPQHRPKWFWVVVVAGAAVAATILIYRYHSGIYAEIDRINQVLHDRYHLKRTIKSYGAYSPLVYILVQLLQVVIAPIPGGAIEFLGGYLFGAKAGFAYSMIGVVLGSLTAFGIARIFEKVAIEKLVDPAVRKRFDYLMGHEGLILSFLLFLIPGFPKDALCYILGLTPMHLGIFLIVSTVGRIPGTLMACLQGAKAFDHQYRTLLILFGISALAIAFFYIYNEEVHQFIKRLRKVVK